MMSLRPTLIALLTPLALAACETSTPPATPPQAQAQAPAANAQAPASSAPAPAPVPAAAAAPPAPPPAMPLADAMGVAKPGDLPRYGSMGVVECDQLVESLRLCVNDGHLDKDQRRTVTREIGSIVNKRFKGVDQQACLDARLHARQQVGGEKGCPGI